MTELSIIFCGDMVRAILEGRKTQTRRIVKMRVNGMTYYPGPVAGFHYDAAYQTWQPHMAAHSDKDVDAGAVAGLDEWKCPYPVGRRLWVRENWRVASINHSISSAQFYTIQFRAGFGVLPHPQPDQSRFMDYTLGDWITNKGETGCLFGRWRPSIFMPRWASRISLEITDVRVERVQDISEADARAEGVNTIPYMLPGEENYPPIGLTSIPQWRFRNLWDSLNSERGQGWAENPWVYASTFRRAG